MNIRGRYETLPLTVSAFSQSCPRSPHQGGRELGAEPVARGTRRKAQNKYQIHQFKGKCQPPHREGLRPLQGISGVKLIDGLGLELTVQTERQRKREMEWEREPKRESMG